MTTTPSTRASMGTLASRGLTQSRTWAATMGRAPKMEIEAEALRRAPLPQGLKSLFRPNMLQLIFTPFLWSGILKDRRPSHHTIEVYAVAPTSIKAAETHPSVITQTHHQSNEIITCNFE